MTLTFVNKGGGDFLRVTLVRITNEPEQICINYESPTSITASLFVLGQIMLKVFAENIG